MRKIYISSTTVALILLFGCISKSEALQLVVDLLAPQKKLTGLTFQVVDNKGVAHDIGHYGTPDRKTGRSLQGGTYRIEVTQDFDVKDLVQAKSYQYTGWDEKNKYITMTCTIENSVKDMKKHPSKYRFFSFNIWPTLSSPDACNVTAY